MKMDSHGNTGTFIYGNNLERKWEGSYRGFCWGMEGRKRDWWGLNKG